MKDKRLELYVHIPFCVRKCSYCDFLSGVYGESIQESYVDALLRHIKGVSGQYKDYVIDTIFFGGGTPSVLKPKLVSKIMECIRNNFTLSLYTETTIECNPGTLDGYKIDRYLDSGFNRMSIGLQSANDNELKALGRIHTASDFLESYLIASNYGFNNINIDLMSAIPYQTRETFTNSLRSVAALKPKHISVYSLIVEENTPMYDWIYTKGGDKLLPSEEEERLMYYDTKKILEEYGFGRYEISNYSQKGYECRHNLGYWERKNYLGIGIGAASLIDNVRFNNTSNLEEYIANPLGACVDKEILSVKDAMSEYMFLGLRKTAGISKAQFLECFKVTYDSVYKDVTAKLIKDGLIIDEDDNIRLTDYGIDVSNQAMAMFLLD